MGKFSTVSESECNIEITISANGKGIFSESCRREDGSHIDDVETFNISWKLINNEFIANIKGSEEKFIYHSNLPCKNFGEGGTSNGLIGYGTYFWREPIKCK